MEFWPFRKLVIFDHNFNNYFSCSFRIRNKIWAFFSSWPTLVVKNGNFFGSKLPTKPLNMHFTIKGATHCSLFKKEAGKSVGQDSQLLVEKLRFLKKWAIFINFWCLKLTCELNLRPILGYFKYSKINRNGLKRTQIAPTCSKNSLK